MLLIYLFYCFICSIDKNANILKHLDMLANFSIIEILKCF